VRPSDADAIADQRPVLVLDLRPHLGAHAPGRDRARIPADGGVRLGLLDHGEPGLRELLAARLEGRLAALIDQPTDRLGERRQRRLAVAGNREVDILVAPEVLIVRLLEQVAGAERDGLGALLGDRAVGANDAIAEGVERAPELLHL